MSIQDEILQANEEYAAAFGTKADLTIPPARSFAILTCMDARLDPAKYAGLSEGDAHVIRNAGGRASDDAIRSLVISHKLLGTKEWFVIHHSNCGMEFFTDEVIRGLLENSLETAELGPDGFRDVGTGPGSTEGKYIDWLTISDNAQSVTEDVARIRAHPLVPGRIPIYGYIYDVTTGRLTEIPEATRRAARSDTLTVLGVDRRYHHARHRDHLAASYRRHWILCASRPRLTMPCRPCRSWRTRTTGSPSRRKTSPPPRTSRSNSYRAS